MNRILYLKDPEGRPGEHILIEEKNAWHGKITVYFSAG
jgi:hypothetical protein